MQLQPHGFLKRFRDQGCERAHVKMTTEHDVERCAGESMSEYVSCVRNPPGSRRCLANSLGQAIPRARAMPRDDQNIADPRGQCQGRKQILVVLGNPAMAAKCVGDKCQDAEAFLWASAQFVATP